MKTIDFKEFNKPFKQIQNENTLKEYHRMLEIGMEQISSNDLLELITELGYKIDKNCTFDYYNTSNSISYKAKAVSYIDIKTGQSFAHYEQSLSNHENLEKLQKIRINMFVYEKDRIWEL